jgi:hypothetical protein
MERSKIAEIICETLYTGHAAALLANVVDDQAKWALASGASQAAAFIEPFHRSEVLSGICWAKRHGELLP